MGKTLDIVMNYANEDVAKIHKHWIIFIKRTIRVLVRIVTTLFVFYSSKSWIAYFADKINQVVPAIPFEIKKYVFPILLLYIFIKTIIDYINTIIEYKTVGLSINNIQLKGKSGLLDVGIVNIPLDQIENVRVHAPFWGRIFHYGSISISTYSANISMTDMINVEKFQDAIVLLQEAQREGRSIRQSERQEQAIEAHAIAQVRAIEAQTAAQVQVLSELSKNINHQLEHKENGLIESNENPVSAQTNE